jgi:hypothetical protein
VDPNGLEDLCQEVRRGNTTCLAVHSAPASELLQSESEYACCLIAFDTIPEVISPAFAVLIEAPRLSMRSEAMISLDAILETNDHMAKII